MVGDGARCCRCQGSCWRQTMPGTAASQSAATSTSRARRHQPAESSAPAGYILSPTDQVSVEVFGEDDLRTSGRLNPEGNLSVPLLGSIHLAGLTLTQAVSKTHRTVQPRLSGQPEDQRHASQLRKTALFDFGSGRSPRHHRNA